MAFSAPDPGEERTSAEPPHPAANGAHPRSPWLAVLGAGDAAVTAVARAVTDAFSAASSTASTRQKTMQQRMADLPGELDGLRARFSGDELRRALDAYRAQLERTYAELVSGNFFSGLGLAPALGRFISPADTAEPGATPVVVISYDYWRTRYDGRRSVIGETIRVNDRPLTIVGVAPEGFQGTVVALQLDLYVPATIAPVIANGSAEMTDRTMRGYSVMGRLRRPVTTAQAQDVVTAAMKRTRLAVKVTGTVGSTSRSVRLKAGKVR